MHFGLKLLLLVRQQVQLHVGVGGATHVHGREVCSLEDAHHQLREGGRERQERGERERERERRRGREREREIGRERERGR